MTTLKHVVEAVLSPLGITLVFVAAGLLLSILKRKPVLARRLLMLGSSLLILFTLSPAAELLIAGLERDYPPLLHPDPAAKIEFIVILSGYGEQHAGLPATSKLSAETVCRMVEGIRLYHRLPDARLVVSGGVLKPGDGSVAGMMAEFLREMGIPREKVVLEERSLTTWENMVDVKAIVADRPFILVTSAGDLRRAMAVAARLRMRPVAAPACIWASKEFPAGMAWSDWAGKVLESFATPSVSRLTYLQWAYHEYAGYLWYRLLGRI